MLALLPGMRLRASEPVSDLRRLRDPATEFEILRYSDPERYSANLLPGHLRSITRSNSLIFCCDRSGSQQLWRMEIKTGEARQITEFPDGVRPGGAVVLPDDRSLCCIHGQLLEHISLAGARARVLHESGAGMSPQEVAVSDDGRTCFLVEKTGGATLVRSIGLVKRSTEVIAEDRDVSGLRPRPGTRALALRRGDTLTLIDADTKAAKSLKIAGTPRQHLWSADGKTLLYLTWTGSTSELREHTPESGEDKLIARTSAFVNFARNGDGSVFVGVSGSKASPHIILLLRVARRELTLSEHRASDPASVSIFFTPDSQRIFYHSDRAGRQAIYSIPAERLVEKTNT